MNRDKYLRKLKLDFMRSLSRGGRSAPGPPDRDQTYFLDRVRDENIVRLGPAQKTTGLAHV